MKRSFCLFSSIGLVGISIASVRAADEDGPSYSFYDPTRPGHAPAKSLMVPRGRPGDSRRVTAYTILRYPGGSNTPKPEIIVAFNGILQEGNVELRWAPPTGERWVKVVVTLPARDLKYGPEGPANPLEVTAKMADGTKITKKLNVTGVDFPPLDEARIVGGFLPLSKFNYTIAYRVPPVPIKFGQDFPLVGKYGFKAQLNGKMNVYPIAGKYTSETTGGAMLTVAGKEYGIDVGSKEETEWEQAVWNVEDGEKSWQPGKWVKRESKIYLGWYTSIPLWEKSLLTLLPEEAQKMVDKIPIIGPKAKMTMADFKFDLTANPSLYGEIGLGLTPEEPAIKSLALGGEMDLRLAFNAVFEINALGKFGVIAMAGGKLNLDIYYPIDNNLIGLQNLSANLYVGTDFYFLCFESSFRFNLLEFHFPDLPQGARRLGSGMELSEFGLVPPPKVGEQIAYPLTPTLKSAPRAGDTSLMADKMKFRRLGSEPVLQRQGNMPMGMANRLSSNPPETSASIEAGAVIPLAVNTTSVAWPGLAANLSDGDMVALFGVDTRPPGTPPGGAQFTKLLWTYYKNGDWSVPAPLPPGNGAAQIAPTVAALSDKKPGFIAAWQQLQDAGFNGTGLAEWLEQTEVAVGILQTEKGQPVWKTELLGTPDRADLSPKAIGNMGSDCDGGMIVWVSASLADAPKGGTGGVPENAEIRYALYHKGKWIQPDAKDEKAGRNDILKVPKGLLSWDISGYRTVANLVYSEDLGNGQSRIVGRYRRIDPEKMGEHGWSDPVQISDAPGTNLNPQILTYRGNVVAVVWIENGDLVARRMPQDFRTAPKEILRPASGGPTPSGIKMTLLHTRQEEDCDIAVSWTEQTPDGPSIVTAVYEYATNSWSKPTAITPGEDLETLYATTTDQRGNLVPLYVHTDVIYGTVQAQNEQGRTVSIPNSPILGREKVMVGRFRPVRDLRFDEDALTSPNEEFIGGTTVQLTARVKSDGMFGYAPQRVSVSFYHGDPGNGGKLIAQSNRLQQKAIPGGHTAEISVDWHLAEDIWDRDNVPESVYAVIDPPLGYPEWNTENNTAVLHLAEIIPSATASSDRALQDGSAEVNVSIHNSGLPYMKSFPVSVYDHSGARLIKSETMPKVDGGRTASINIELPAESVRGEKGADFLIKVDPENTLKLHPDRRVRDMKLHISSAPSL